MSLSVEKHTVEKTLQNLTLLSYWGKCVLLSCVCVLGYFIYVLGYFIYVLGYLIYVLGYLIYVLGFYPTYRTF